MKRFEIAPGAFVSVLEGDRFKRGKLLVHLVVPGEKENATRLAVLPHVLDRRCAAIPDATALSRRLYALYGAEVSSESYTAGASRVVTLGISGLKNEYALAGEDLTAEYLEIVCGLLFEPVVEKGAFARQDVEIEKAKQADYLEGEINDKRSYCLRQARRKLYGASPLGIESAGYLEDVAAIDAENLYQSYAQLLRTAQVEVLVCGMDENKVADALAARLAGIDRRPVPLQAAPPLEKAAAFPHYAEAMATVQGKLAILCTSGKREDAKGEVVMRLASALYGGLPTSRLFMNVREKQSLCYYCSSSYGYFGGLLTVDSGVNHKDAERAEAAILAELDAMQRQPVTPEELDNAKRYMRSVFSAAKDSPDALMNFAFTEWLKGTSRTLDEMMEMTDTVTGQEIMTALAGFAPAVQYQITGKEGA